MRALLALLFVPRLLVSCLSGPGPKLTPVEIQAIQTREFETTKELAFRSVVGVFQDTGYTIDTASLETGLITASSTSHTEFQPFVGNVVKLVRATATVEGMPNGKTNVRINLVKQSESSSLYGQRGANSAPILDAQEYENLFSRVQQGIFLRSAVK